MLQHRQRGVTVTTFALIVPVLMFFIFGMSESGRIMFAWLVITNEAAEAARYGAVHYDPTRDPVLQANDVKTFINQRLNGVLAMQNQPAPLVTVTSTPSVQVTLNYKVELIVPLVSQFLPNPFPISARSVMAAEPGS